MLKDGSGDWIQAFSEPTQKFITISKWVRMSKHEENIIHIPSIITGLETGDDVHVKLTKKHIGNQSRGSQANRKPTRIAPKLIMCALIPNNKRINHLLGKCALISCQCYAHFSQVILVQEKLCMDLMVEPLEIHSHSDNAMSCF